MINKSFLALVFFLLKLAISAGLVYLAYIIPGQRETSLQFINYAIDMKTGLLAAGILLSILLIYYAIKLSRWLVRLPDRTKIYLTERRLQKSKENTLESLVALASGEIDLSIDLAECAQSQDPSNIYAAIFSAQGSLLQGNTWEAEHKYQQLLNQPLTRFLGLRGLITLKQKQKRWGEAHSLLQDALKERPQSTWTLTELLKINIQEQAFERVETILNQLKTTRAITRQKADHYQAILHWLKAEHDMALGASTKIGEKAETELQKALKNDPQLTVASIALATLYGKKNKLSKAQRCLINGYEARPHADYLETIQEIMTGPSQNDVTAIDRYQFAEEMTFSHPDVPETHFILASLALKAKLWGQARLHLNFLRTQQPTQSYYRLMAELESAEPPMNPDRAKIYLTDMLKAPQDPLWICQDCHKTSQTWTALCTSCHSFDSLAWERANSSM